MAFAKPNVKRTFEQAWSPSCLCACSQCASAGQCHNQVFILQQLYLFILSNRNLWIHLEYKLQKIHKGWGRQLGLVCQQSDMQLLQLAQFWLAKMWNKIVCEFHHMNLRAKETEECQIQIELVSCLFVCSQVTSPMQWRFSIQTTNTNGIKGRMATPTRMTFRRSSKRPLTSPLNFEKSCCKFVSISFSKSPV